VVAGVIRGRAIEQVMIGEAIAKSSAQESIGRRLGDELIVAAREAISEFQRLRIETRSNRFRGLAMAIRKLETLVGKP
jgi:hypothetical protein